MIYKWHKTLCFLNALNTSIDKHSIQQKIIDIETDLQPYPKWPNIIDVFSKTLGDTSPMSPWTLKLGGKWRKTNLFVYLNMQHKWAQTVVLKYQARSRILCMSTRSLGHYQNSCSRQVLSTFGDTLPMSPWPLKLWGKWIKTNLFV